VSPEKGIKLVVPTMDKVGQLRQAPARSKPESPIGWPFQQRTVVEAGDRVDIVIGNFRARGLLVE